MEMVLYFLMFKEENMRKNKKILIFVFIIILLIYPIKQISYLVYLEYNSTKNSEETALSRNEYKIKLESLINKYDYISENFENIDNKFGFDIKVDGDLLVSVSNWYDVEYIEIYSLDTKGLILKKDNKKINFIAEAYNLFALHEISEDEIYDYINSLKIADSDIVTGQMKKLTLSNKIYFHVLDDQFYLQGITKH